jgi:hypothetical protein
MEKSMNQWISIEDKLPDTLWKDVLAYRKSGKIQVVRYFGGHDDCGYFSDGECYGEAKDLGITHWMKLPAPPAEKEKNNE